jgi:hypothetical protein
MLTIFQFSSSTIRLRLHYKLLIHIILIKSLKNISILNQRVVIVYFIYYKTNVIKKHVKIPLNIKRCD